MDRNQAFPQLPAVSLKGQCSDQFCFHVYGWYKGYSQREAYWQSHCTSKRLKTNITNGRFDVLKCKHLHFGPTHNFGPYYINDDVIDSGTSSIHTQILQQRLIDYLG